MRRAGVGVVVLGLSPRGFGTRDAVRLWLQGSDRGCADLMVLPACVVANHPDSSRAGISCDEVGNIAFVIGVSDVEIERDEGVEGPQAAPCEGLGANADQSASQDRLPKPAAESAGA